MKCKYRVGVVRVVTLQDEELLNRHGRLIERYFPNIETRSVCIPDQPKGIYNYASKAVAIPKILEIAQREFADMDGIIVSCADDPGVEELRLLLPGMPVMGAGACVCAAASLYGSYVGAIGITDEIPDPLKGRTGLQLEYVKPGKLDSTLDFLTEAGRTSVVKEAMRYKEKGAQAIILACTGISSAGVATEVERAISLPVVDAVLAEGLFMYYEIVKKNISANVQ